MIEGEFIEVEFTEAEKDQYGPIIAIKFAVYKNGSVEVNSCWVDADVCVCAPVVMPPRVARIGLTWVNEQLAEKAWP